MDKLFSLDLQHMWVPTTSVLEILVRGSIMYLSIFLILRVILKRQSQGVSITDILLIVLIADASQNGMSAQYRSVTEGLLLIGTLVFWNFLLDWLAYTSPWFGRLVQPAALPLVENGRMLPKNMRQELITVEELLSNLRLEGVERIEDVAKAYMEPNGTISVIKKGNT
jgi:uncharacterized membrane protein YcaP (DUF421 family)